MSEENRATLIGALWFISAVVLGALFVSAAAQGDLTSAHILLALLIIGLAVAGTVRLLNMKDSTEQAKAKRERVDRFLHDLSEEELLDLKRLLSNDDEKPISHYMGDDGELELRR